MKRRTLYLDELLGCKVYDVDGKYAGRIEEAIARSGRDGVIEEFLIGQVGLFARLSVTDFARRLLRPLGAIGETALHRVPCGQMDLTEPRRPRLRCPISALKKMK